MRTKFARFVVLATLVSVPFAAASCSKENTVNQNNNTNYTSVTQMVSASQLTTVIHPEGANLFFPAGAVDNDTEVTVSNVPPAEAPPLPGGASLVGQIFKMEPHGLGFIEPVTLQLATNGQTVPIFHATPGGSWQQTGGFTNGLYMETEIHQFSFYAALKTGGGGTGGGGSIGDASVDEGTPFAGGDNACNSCASTDCFPALAECGANFDCNACNTGMFSADCDAPNSPLFQDLVNCACTSPGACTGDCDCALALSLMIGGGE